MRFEFSAGAVIYRHAGAGKRLLFLFLVKENGEYDVPKGHVERGESPETAAKREIREESGLSVWFLPWASIDARYFFYKGREKVLKRLRVFIAETKTEKVRISHEHRGYEWLDYSQAQERIKFKDMRQTLQKAYDYIVRYEGLLRLNREYAELPKKPGWNLSDRLVSGDGPLNAEVMLVGQAPGREEDLQSKPFVGRSGRLLDQMLHKAGIERRGVYITSVVQFFPPKNRMPTGKEVMLCMPFLRKQIEIIRPRFIITLGSLSGRMLAGITSVDKEHGRITKNEGITYMATYHPAASLRFTRVKKLMQDDVERFGTYIKAA